MFPPSVFVADTADNIYFIYVKENVFQNSI